MKLILDKIKKEIKKQGLVLGKEKLEKSFMKKANENVEKLKNKATTFFKDLGF